MIKKTFTYLFLISSLSITHAQNNKVIDSLKIASIETSGEIRAQLFNQLGWEYRLKNPDSTLYYCNQALNIAKSNENHGVYGTALNFIGIAYGYKGDYSAAFKTYNESMEYAIEHEDSLNLAHAQNSLGRLLFSQGDLINSYEYFFSALSIFKIIGDKAGMGYCYKSLSELYQTQDNLEKALTMSLKALEIRQVLKNTRGQISSYHEIAEIYLKLNQHEKSLEYLDVAQNISVQTNDRVSLIETYLGMSNIFYHQKLFQEALDFGLKSLDPNVRNQNRLLQDKVYLLLGKIYFASGNFNKSEEFLSNLIDPQVETIELAITRDANLFLSIIHEKKKNNELAIKHLRAYNIVNDSLNSSNIARSIARMETRFDLQEMEKENKLLKIQKLVDESEIEKQKNRNLALTAASTLILFIIVFVIRYTRQKIKHSRKLSLKNEQIEVQNKKIQDQNSGLEKRNFELAELNREKDNLMNIVAHDLRSPFNNLKGIADLIQLSGKLNDEQTEYLTLLKNVATKGSHLTRDILDVNAFETNDEPNIISKINIYDFLVEVHNEFSESSQQKSIKLKISSIDPKINVLSEKSHLSRIVDNLLSNAIKYSQPNTIIELGGYQKDGLTFISVKDQGPGFTEEDQKFLYKKFNKLSARPTGGEPSNGLGLAIVKTLTNRLKGDINLVTSTEGSEFTLSLPDID